MCHDRGNDHAQADIEEAGRHVVSAFFLTPNQFLHRRATTPAQCCGPSNGAKPSGCFFGLPIACCLHAFGGREVLRKIIIRPGFECGVGI